MNERTQMRNKNEREGSTVINRLSGLGGRITAVRRRSQFKGGRQFVWAIGLEGQRFVNHRVPAVGVRVDPRCGLKSAVNAIEDLLLAVVTATSLTEGDGPSHQQNARHHLSEHLSHPR
jgi:hypothetical protein